MSGAAPIAYAQQHIDALNRYNMEGFPKYQPLLENAHFPTRVVPFSMNRSIPSAPTLYLLQATVALVPLIGRINIANLMLVRSHVRLKELAIRYSPGGGPLAHRPAAFDREPVLALSVR